MFCLSFVRAAQIIISVTIVSFSLEHVACAASPVTVHSLTVGLFHELLLTHILSNPLSAAIVGLDHISGLSELEPHVWHSSD